MFYYNNNNIANVYLMTKGAKSHSKNNKKNSYIRINCSPISHNINKTCWF